MIDFDKAKNIQNAKKKISHIPYIQWSSKIEDEIENKYYNLTQIPFDMEVDEYRFSFDYQVSIHFEFGRQK